MSASTGILSPSKTANENHHDSPEERGEDVFSSRAKELADAKSASKCVRVMTVMAYVLSVSMAAILLSLYYVFLWDPAPPSKDPDSPMAFRDDPRSGMVPFNGSDGISYMAFYAKQGRRVEVSDTNGNSTGQVEKAMALPLVPEVFLSDSNSTDISTETNTLLDAGLNNTEEASPSPLLGIDLDNKMSNSLLIAKISRNTRNDTKSNNT